MKKISTILLAVAFVFALSSCKKTAKEETTPEVAPVETVAPVEEAVVDTTVAPVAPAAEVAPAK